MKTVWRIVLLLCVLTMLPFVSAAAVAAPLEPYPTGISGEARWTLQGDTMYITGEGILSGVSNADCQPWEYFQDQIRHVVIADGVTLVGDNIFAHTTNLETVTVADSVTEICEGAFRNCYLLKTVKLPAGLETLRDFAFAYCEKLESIELPDTLTVMGEGVFTGCSAMTSLRLPANLYDIRQLNFDSCMSLTKITIPAGVGFLRHASFSNCFALKTVIFEGDQPNTNGDPFYMGPDDLMVYCYQDAGGWDDALFYTYPVVKLQRGQQPAEEVPDQQPESSADGPSAPEETEEGAEKPADDTPAAESGKGDMVEKPEEQIGKQEEPSAPAETAGEPAESAEEPVKETKNTMPVMVGGIMAAAVYWLGSKLSESIRKNRKKK